MTKASNIVDSIGHTPFVELQRVVPSGCARVLVKLESQNPTGSMKDRMALAVVTGAISRRELLPGWTVTAGFDQRPSKQFALSDRLSLSRLF